MNSEPDLTEDAMAQRIIEYHKEDEGETSSGTEIKLSKIVPEAHYNHYGSRGVADLYIEKVEIVDGEKRYYEHKLYEIKSDYAIENSTGANEIIRQFNKMRRYFFKDDSWVKRGSVHFELCFIATPKSAEHVHENQELYKHLREVVHFESYSNVLLRRPDDEDFQPAHVSTYKEKTGFENIAITRPDLVDVCEIPSQYVHE